MLIEQNIVRGGGKRPTTHNKRYFYKEDTKINKNAIKKEAIENLVVNNIDSDTRSLVYMNAVLNIANYQAINQLASSLNIDISPVYATAVDWKKADNTISPLQINQFPSVMNQAMLEIAKAVGATNE
jgi:hypothetical protein